MKHLMLVCVMMLCLAPTSGWAEEEAAEWFNEPGETLWDGAHEETLDDSTIEANKRFFAKKEDVPTHAVTMGMGNIMRAKRLLMIISGNKQEAATRLLIDNRIDPKCPCTFLRLHRDATVVIEKELADKIGYKG